ncbi:hypothetical protein EDB89DRAFT_1909556 [Lactarius sanguifluus]|nr:hypothetical protein EDB89DRAFT_1909556 [Lactarius sanguifluus]
MSSFPCQLNQELNILFPQHQTKKGINYYGPNNGALELPKLELELEHVSQTNCCDIVEISILSGTISFYILLGRMFYPLFATPLIGLVLWLIARLAQRVFRNLPPGPKGLPFIGDVQHAADHGWLAPPQRKDNYGNILDLQSLPKFDHPPSSQRVAVDLLEKRFNLYSDRPRFISVNEFLTENLTFVFTGYGDLYMMDQACRWTRFFTEWVLFISTSANMIASRLWMGWKSESDDEPVIVGIVDHVQRVGHELEPGARLVEFFPWMRYIPSRFAKWKRDAQHWFIQDSLRHERLLNKVADDLAKAIDQPSFGATLIKNQEKYRLSEREQAWLVGDMLLSSSADLRRPPLSTIYPRDGQGGTAMVSLGVSHVSSADDWYEATFNPARYLDEKGQVKPLMDGREEGTCVVWRPEGAEGELDMHAFAPSGIAQQPSCAFRVQGSPSGFLTIWRTGAVWATSIALSLPLPHHEPGIVLAGSSLPILYDRRMSITVLVTDAVLSKAGIPACG